MPVDRFFSAVSEVKIRVAILEVMRINNQSLSAFLYMCRHDFAGLKYCFHRNENPRTLECVLVPKTKF